MQRFVLSILVVIVLATAWLAVSQRSQGSLVVYCAHDLIFAEEILHDFQQETGIPVIIVGDTEATKSLGLVQRLLREKEHPNCDVFWNNQVLGTMELAEAGVLKPYKGPGFQRIPDGFKDPEGRWTGFAGRLRVWILNNSKMTAQEETVTEKFAGDDLSRMAIAMPIYGTTLSHFSILWQQKGGTGVKEFFESLQSRQCKIVPGNSTVKNLVAEGVCDFGWTDTDDFFVGKDDGADVSMLPIRVDGRTICLPNSVAMINGTEKEKEAARLIDYLLSAEIELKMSKSASRQIPLGPVDETELPEEVRPLAAWAKESVDVMQFAKARKDCLEWLQTEFASSE